VATAAEEAAADTEIAEAQVADTETDKGHTSLEIRKPFFSLFYITHSFFLTLFTWS
jgi:hypothetical protein